MGSREWTCLLGVSTAVLYGSLSLFVSILHNVFLLYYVDTFVSVYKIDKLSFWVGEVSCCCLAVLLVLSGRVCILGFIAYQDFFYCARTDSVFDLE